MKRNSIFAFLIFISVAICQAQDSLEGLFYAGEFETAGPPLAIAADSNGGIYYTVFTFGGADLTRCYYVPNPLDLPPAEEHILVDNAADTEVPAGRGFHGVAVDSQGNVFLALESGNNSTATVRKLSPAPAFEPVEEFFGGVVFPEKRHNGVDLIDDSTLILGSFGDVDIWDANDATPLLTFSGSGNSFQRDVAYNPGNGDIYISRNGQDLPGVINIAQTETPGDPFSYTGIEMDFIAEGAVISQFGINAQLVEYDASNDLLIVPDYAGDAPRVAFYAPAAPEAAAFYLDGTDSESGAFDTPADTVAVSDGSGESSFFITDNGLSRIFVYSTAITHVADWQLME